MSKLWASLSSPGVLVPVLAMLVCGAPVWAQNAVVSGRVSDTSGAVVPGVNLELRNTATGLKQVTATNAEGLFVFPPVSPGTYDVSARAAGFSVVQMNGMTLEVGQSRSLSLTLTPSALNETITVNDSAPNLNLDRADRGTVVENKFVMSIPLATRNPLLLVTLTAGVVPGNNLVAGDNTTSQSQTNEFRINGGRTTTNEILIDGAANTGTYNNQASAIPQVDAIQEFKINTNPYDAEFGHTGGGIISYSIKSGTNELHGNLHEFLQNELLDANGFNANKARTLKSSRKKNQFGFTIGGPIEIPRLYHGKNKTFFFAGYEGLRQHSFSSFTGTVPTSIERTGDFSQTFDTSGKLKVIYNPHTTRLDTSSTTTRYIRDAFAGNQIPSNLLNTVAANILKYYPTPNQTGVGKSDTNNYFSAAPNTLSSDRVDARIDHQFSEKHALFARGNWFQNLNTNPLVYGNPQSPVQTPNLIPGENWMVNDTLTLSPHTVFVQHFSMATSQTNRIPLTLGFDQTSLGLPSTVTKGQIAAYFPTVSVSGFSGVGHQGTAYNVVMSRTYQYAAAMTMLRGSHTLKAGVDWRYYTLSWMNPQPLQISGGGSYTAGPNPQSATTNTGSGLSDLLLGATSVSYGKTPTYENRHPYYAGFFQDEWKPTRRLTLSFGVRYNLELGSVENANRYVFIDVDSKSPLSVPGYDLKGGIGFTGVNGIGRRAQLADKNNWDPRFGFAFRVNDKTALRGGIGRFHHPQLSTSVDVSQGFTRTTSAIVAEADAVTPTYALSNPFPSGIQEPTGNANGLATLIGQSISGPLRHQRIAYQTQWSFDLQRQLPWGFVGEIGYSGSSAVALPYAQTLNQLRPEQLQLGSQLIKTVSNPFYV